MTASVSKRILFGGPEEDSPCSKISTAAAETSIVGDLVQTYFHYVGKIWVHEHPVPLTYEGLKDFDLLTAKPDYDAFKDSGGVIPLDEGLDLEETWLFCQLTSKSEVNCLINADSPAPPPGRIRHLVSLPPRALVMQLALMLQNPEVSEGMMTVLVYDGFFGHVITAVAFDQDLGKFIYHDPWPETSLLCAPCNRAGVAAGPAAAPYHPGLWSITGEEMSRVLYAVMVTLPPGNHPEVIVKS